ncbi:MAG: M16 family metallopeptidase [Solirubrobacterales bacterium]
MSAEPQVTQLDSGVRVVTEGIPSVRSVALGLWSATGSRDEDPEQAGISHFLEHLLFKGTERHSAIEISEFFDGIGASVNAATSKETTHLHARFLDERLDEAFEVMSEMMLGPTYQEVDSEREVVIEEIAMYEDEPQDTVHDILGRAVFGDHPLGRPIIGRKEVISSVPIPAIREYHESHYNGSNLVVSAAGHLDHQRIVELAERCFSASSGQGRDISGVEPAEPNPRRAFKTKDTEQFHICLGGPGVNRTDDRRFALSVLDTIFGGSSASRLFREIREKRGLAYAIGSYYEHYLETGMVALYLGTRADNVGEACHILGDELRRLSEPISDTELARAKESIKGRMVLAMESPAARMGRNGRSLLLDVPLLSVDELLARIDAVSAEDVAALGAELYAPERLSAACVGPDEERFRSALEPVSESLAAAA